MTYVNYIHSLDEKCNNLSKNEKPCIFIHGHYSGQVVYSILGEYAIESHQTTIDSYFSHMST
jgi:hypothetical protein